MQDAELLRYARHVLLPEVGIEGQTRWHNTRALLVGAGGLGCAAGLYLAAAGLGSITVVDHDVVELSNLQRQIGHPTERIGSPKALSLAQQMRAINPCLQVQAVAERATADNLGTWLDAVDVVLDCTDHFAIRQALNAACVGHRKPLVSASALGFSGQLAVWAPHQQQGACYACLYPPDMEPQEVSCVSNGVLGPLVGVMGSMQACQALLVAAVIGQPLYARLLLHDARDGSWNTIHVPRLPHCPVCGPHK